MICNGSYPNIHQWFGQMIAILILNIYIRNVQFQIENFKMEPTRLELATFRLRT